MAGAWQGPQWRSYMKVETSGAGHGLSDMDAREYQAPAGSRQFEHPLPVGAAAGVAQQRDFRSFSVN